MNAPETMSCPSEETLAAFIDGRLDSDARQRVIEHMTICAECRDIVLAASEFRADESKPDSQVTHIASRRASRVLFGAAGLAAAAVIIFVVGPILRGKFFSTTGIDALVEASESLEHRRVEGRLVGGFAYRPVKPVLRGPGETEDNLSLLIAAREIKRSATENATPENLHALAVSLLLLGKTDQAVSGLETALTKTTGERDVTKALQLCPDATLLSDLAVAYLAQARATGSALHSLRATEAAQRAWVLRKTPETAWNRALAIEKLFLNEDAAAAWRDYLKLDPSSRWAVEARERLEGLGRRTTSEAWDSAKEKVVDAARRGDLSYLETLAAEFPEQLRSLAEDQLLVSASNQILRGDDAKQGLRDAAAVAQVLKLKTGDSFVADVAEAMRRSASPKSSAQAYLQFIEGRRLYRDSEIDRAVVELERAEIVLRADGSPLSGMCVLFRASCAYYKNDYRRALELTSSLLGRGDDHRYPVLFALCQWVRGISHFSVGQMNEALGEYSAARDVFKRIGHRDGELAVIGLLASGYDLIGDRDRAWDLRLTTLRMLASFGRGSSRSPQTIRGAAIAAQRDGFLGTAILLTDREIEATSERTWADVRFAAYGRRSELNRSQGDLPAAERDLVLARNTVRLINDDGVRAFATTHPDYIRAFTAQTSDPVERLASIGGALEFAESTANESRKVELLLQLGAELAGQGNEQRSEQVLEEALAIIDSQRQRFSNLELRDHYLDERRDVYRRIASMIATRGESDRALYFAERARARTLSDAYDRHLVSSPVLSISDLRSRIPPGTLAVYFMSDRDRLLVWILEAAETRFMILPVSTGSIEDLTAKIMGSNSRVADQAVDALSLLIVAPWSGAVDSNSTVVFIPDDGLSSVPFVALRIDRRPILEHSRIEVAPSLSLFVRCMERDRALRARASTEPLLVVAPPTTGGDLPFLTNAGPEADLAVASHLREVRRLSGTAATKQAILSAGASACAIHFAGHALFNEMHPSYAAISVARSPDGVMLYAHEIASARLPSVRLVVLAACDGLRAASRQREGASSIGRAFIAAGVPVVIGAIRPVDDAVTILLFERFYDEIRSGSNPAEALRHAQLSLMDKYPISSWAAFQVLGGVAETKGEKWLI